MLLADIYVKGDMIMYSILVLSHGDFANGLKDTMMMIAGSQDESYFINFTPSDSIEDFEKKVKVIYHAIPKDNEILIMTDLYGGTPNHVATRLRMKQQGRVEVVSGINLAMLLTAITSRHLALNDIINKIVSDAQKGIQRITVNSTMDEEDE